MVVVVVVVLIDEAINASASADELKMTVAIFMFFRSEFQSEFLKDSAQEKKPT